MAKKRRKNNLPLIILTITFAVVTFILAIFLILMQFNEKYPALTGNYLGKVDISDVVSANIIKWLSAAEDVDIKSEEIIDALGPVEVELNMVTKAKGKGKGTISIKIDENCMEKINNQVNALLTSELDLLIEERLSKMGYDVEAEDLDGLKLAKEALQMDLAEYIASIDLEIVPSYAYLQEIYELEGNYTLDDYNITFISGRGEDTHPYVFEDGKLVLTDDLVIFEVKEDTVQK